MSAAFPFRTAKGIDMAGLKAEIKRRLLSGTQDIDRLAYLWHLPAVTIARMIEETKEMTEEARRLERESTREHGDK